MPVKDKFRLMQTLLLYMCSFLRCVLPYCMTSFSGQSGKSAQLMSKSARNGIYSRVNLILKYLGFYKANIFINFTKLATNSDVMSIINVL